jgi:hypothetical protein
MTVLDSASPVREVDRGLTFETWQGSGAMRLDWSRQGHVRVIVHGHGHVDYADAVVARWESVRRVNGRVTLHIDFWEMPTYDSGLRVGMTGWATKNRDSVDGVHVVTRSKLVSMGVSVANLAMGGIFTTHVQRAEFDLLMTKLGLPLNPSMRK